jgi:hypothetical protein
MKRLDFRKLTVALAAASSIASGTTPAFSYDVTPVAILDMLQQHATEQRPEASAQVLDRLRRLGVQYFLIGNLRITLDELVFMINDPQSRVAMAELAMAARQGNIGFVVNNRVIEAVNVDTLDSFPVSSAG